MNRPQTITNNQANEIISRMDIRDKCITQIMIDTGLRISDVLNLRKNDIKNGIIQQKKTKKNKKLDFTAENQKLLDNYINWYYIDDLLFPQKRNKNKPIARSTYYRSLNRVSENLHIKVSPHSFRKIYAQNIYATTHNIYAVQQSLQHKYISTTATYLDIALQFTPITPPQPKQKMFHVFIKWLKRFWR
jgi:integrase